ncbi:pyridoxal phosphate-dependent decarboxylase family protein [Halotia branconii]|uniref:Aspartate aminotransferase family protein n=1 Tax=Halotia branconii CENA392 TaxID=1539056 RepID=A0AAJ6P955_9CYAN|nr:aspartate aminotransferase family protein [Halotia branconii]WGV25332.1 aspartate aminotransferase family protein [Halotia branconii CENA392]
MVMQSVNSSVVEDLDNFDSYFLTNSSQSIAAYKQAMAIAQEAIIEAFASQNQPYSGVNPQDLAKILATIEPCPEFGQQLQNILTNIGENILNHSAIISHPACIAHLHCPPLLPSLAAEVLISASNQSMDSWDQSPAATLLEQRLIDWLCKIFGYQTKADGVFTSGGTQSNFMGLLLARDAFAFHRLSWSIQQQGLPPEFQRFRILCSDVSHFTISQAASLLGLGQQAVVMVKTDSNYCLDADVVERKLAELQSEDSLPIALVGTVGTTDFGSIDPLPELADCARKYGLWFHLDAAYGGALILSDKHKHKLDGIWTADSITVDFHKLFYQPISCGAFLVKERKNFELIKLHADYLNPQTNQDAGIPDLVTKSVQTTRRFDALKLFVSLRNLGKKKFARMIDSTIELAQETASLIKNQPKLELANYPTINAVVFRYLPSQALTAFDCERVNQINSQIRMQLMQQGIAVLAQTKISELTYLKFTLLNPRTSLVDIKKILQAIQEIGDNL